MGILNLHKDFKGKDYNFIDKIVKQQFQIGGTIIVVHKYLGPKSQENSDDLTKPSSLDELTVQDLLFLENRDRKYDKDLIELKGHYNVNDLEFNLSQFGLMLAGDVLFITFHINEMIERLGRKLIAGDVLELIHRRDDLLLDEDEAAINAFYVIKDAARAAEGYSPTWFPHIWRTKAEPLKDSQEYKDIFDRETEDNCTLKDSLSTYDKFIEISEAIENQANNEVGRRNFDSSHFFIKTDGNLSTSNLLPWVFNGDGIPPNQNDVVPSGTRFPQNPDNGDHFLRTDYEPHRLFVRDDERWRVIEDNWRKQYQSAHRVLVDYLDDSKITDFGECSDEDTINQRQPLSNVLPPKADIPPIDELKDIVDDEEDD